MEVIICPDEHQVGRVAAERVVSWVQGLATPVLGLATGSSPLALYGELARRVAAGEADFSHGLGFALDEYVGIDPENPLSYRQTIRRTVVEPLRMEPSRVRVPDGAAPDLAAAAHEYDQAIRAAGGVDVQVLGIGSNGHIGFNEPTSSFGSRTRVKTLTQQTRADNARFFAAGEQVPTVVTGSHKADAVAAMVEGPVAAVCPGSILQFHPSVLVVTDEAAAAGLKHADYFRYVADNLI